MPLSNKKLRRKSQGKVNRAKVEMSPGHPASALAAFRWKQFAKEIEHAVEQLAHLEAELRKLEGRSGLTAQARTRERCREVRKLENAAGASLGDLKHSMSVIRHGEIEAERAKKDLVEAGPSPGCFGRQEVRQPRIALAGSDPGRQYRPDARGRQVRIQARI